MSSLQFEFIQKIIHRKNRFFKNQTFEKFNFCKSAYTVRETELSWSHQCYRIILQPVKHNSLVALAVLAQPNTTKLCWVQRSCVEQFAFALKTFSVLARKATGKTVFVANSQAANSASFVLDNLFSEQNKCNQLKSASCFALEHKQVSFYDQNFKLKKRIQKKLLNGYSKIHELKLVTIGLASPEKIQSWAEKELPNGKIFGEVTNANTFHYRTFKPSKGGLFCERIFGPLKDFECACGKRKKLTAIESKKILEHEQTSRSFCPTCDVEYTWSILRRYQLGYIKLNAPVTHLWYFKTNPSYLSILFDMKKKDLESIIYCTQTITIENFWKYSEQNSSLTRSPTDLYLKWQKFFSIEEKTKEHQMIYQNKKEKQRQKKKEYRNHFLEKNIVQKQKNWQNFKTQNFLTSVDSAELRKLDESQGSHQWLNLTQQNSAQHVAPVPARGENLSSSLHEGASQYSIDKLILPQAANQQVNIDCQNQAESTNFINSESNLSLSFFKQYKNFPLSSFSVVQQKQIDILVNIYKQKQKTFVSFAIQDIWKKFLQKSYQKSFIFDSSIKFLVDNFFICESSSDKLSPLICQLTFINEASHKDQLESKIFVSDNQLTASKHLQKTIQNFSIFFFFSTLKPIYSTKKYKRLFSTNEKSIFENLKLFSRQSSIDLKILDRQATQHNEVMQNGTSHQKVSNANTTELALQDRYKLSERSSSENRNNFSIHSSFDSLVKNQGLNIKMNESFKELNKKKIHKTKFWKSLFFLLEFGILFLQQRKKKIKNLLKLSKKDVLFLFNLLPFLRKYKIFQNTTFVNKDLKKIQFVLQNSVKKSVYQKNSNFDYKICSVEQIQFEIKNIFLKRKFLVSKPNISLFSNLRNLNKTNNFSFNKKQPNIMSQSKQSDLDNLLNFDYDKSSIANSEMISLKFSKLSQNKNFILLKEKIDFLQAKQIEKNISFFAIFKISMHFEKVLCFLKTYYEIDFCSIFYNSIFFASFSEETNRIKQLSDVEKNVFFENSLNFKKWETLIEQGIEIFVQKSQIYSLIEKVCFEYFTFILYLFKSNFVFSSYSNNQLVLANWKSEKQNVHLCIENSKAQNSLFMLLNYVSVVFFNKCNKINKTLKTFHSKNSNTSQRVDKVSNQSTNLTTSANSKSNFFEQESSFENKQFNNIEKKVFSRNLKKSVIAEKIHIYNKQFISKVKFYQQKKQISLSKFMKFFYFSLAYSEDQANFFGRQNESRQWRNLAKLRYADEANYKARQFVNQRFTSFVPSFNLESTSKQKTFSGHNKKTNFVKNEKIRKIDITEQNFIKKNKKKANFDIIAQDSLTTKTNSASLSARLLGKQFSKWSKRENKNQKVTIKKASFPKTNIFLKNKILTIAYNHVWNNDADWKYFVYYNSLFLHQFEDIPIFIYRSISSISEKPRKSKKMKNIKEAYPTSQKINKSFLPFFDFDFSLKNDFVGAGILEKLLTEYTSVELRKMTIQHQILLPKIQQTLRFLKQTAKTKKDSLKIQKYFQKREHIIRRLKFLRKFSRRNTNPSFMILRNLPVLPPDLRPILKLQNQIAASDLNRFYQRIIYRNERFKKFAKDSATNHSFEIKYAQRLLQEAVDNLIQNGKGSVKAETNSRGQPLKSLSEILKGKQGRFRQYLLGKRVDYSGRSVIVVGPELKLYECGIPKEMALELFLPFLIQYILKYKLAQTVIGAKNLLKYDSTLTIHLLQKVIKNVPVLLNRAPTLHRLGFQAFLPKLIDGRAILLHPMVCPGFNADFDGDQMAVHIPLTVEARTEAWKFMLSMNNFINSATGEPVLLPSQDMVLGCFYLTNDFLAKFVGIQFSNSLKKQNFVRKIDNFKNQKNLYSTKNHFYNFVIQNKSFLFFQNFSSVITAYQRKEIFIHTPIWIKVRASLVDFGNESSKPIEIRLQVNGTWEKIQPRYTITYDRQNNILTKYIRTTVGRIFMNLMIQECIHYESCSS